VGWLNTATRVWEYVPTFLLKLWKEVPWMVVEITPEVSHNLPTIVYSYSYIWATTTSPKYLLLLILSHGYHYQHLHERQLDSSGLPRNLFRGVGGWGLLQEFISGVGVQQIQLRTEGRENGDLGGGSLLVTSSTHFANEWNPYCD
jgi:hypothetical protein